VAAFRRIVAGLERPEEMEIDAEKMSLADRINEILERLLEDKQVTFEALIGERRERRKIIYTFLAILELMKLRMIRAYQAGPFGAIRISPAVEDE
jgi:segregation and condensation protein A